MQKVTSANLNGNAYQFDEDAYGLLAAYLERAKAQLELNPDRAEIMADIEQAIAEKCSRLLGSRKTVVSAAEIQQVIDEMGPVESGAKEESAASGAREPTAPGQAAVPGAPKRLYQIREGAMLSGVCNGLAAYFNLDVTIVRLVFVALTIVTYGAWIFVYGTMMFIVPYADTSEQRAAAHGVTFNAQELVEQAKRKYEDLKNNKQWRGHWKRQRRQWKQWQCAARQQARWAAANAGSGAGQAAEVATATLMPLLAVAEFALFLVLAFAVYSLATTGAVFGWKFPPNVPLWAAILILMAGYAILVSPLAAARHAAHYRWAGRIHPTTAWDSLTPLLVFAVLLWLGYQYVPAVHNAIHAVMIALHIHRYQ